LRKYSITGVLALMLAAGAAELVAGHRLARSSAPATTYLSMSFPSNGTGFVTASRGAAFLLFSTTNGGRSWHHFKLHFGIDVPQIAPGTTEAMMGATEFLDASRGWIAGYSLGHCEAGQPQSQTTCPDGLYTTRMGGKTWTRQLALGVGSNLDGFQMVNRKTGWAMTSQCHLAKAQATCGYQQVVERTKDGGKHWARVRWSVTNVAGFHFLDSKRGWAVTRPPAGSSACYSAVYVTTTGGRKWARKLRLPSQCQTLAVFPDLSHGWVLSADAASCGTGGCATTQLRRTRDGGHSWVVEQGATKTAWDATSGFPQEMGFSDLRHGWVTFRLGTSLETAGGIAVTTNGALTWKRSLPCYQVEPGAATIRGNAHLWLAGSWVSYCSQAKGSGLFRSADWGRTWQQIWPKQ
jgi:photosystem II stability/assembly factor-like uncharacterized protein